MSFVNIKVHMVFSTLNRTPLLTRDIRQNVFDHIKMNSIKKGIYIDCLNGYSDHVHCLISLGKDASISKIAQLIKGESSFWINQNKLTSRKFAWQGEYYAAGIGESELMNVRNYIYNQELHHQKRSFNDEVNEFMNQYGWELIDK